MYAILSRAPFGSTLFWGRRLWKAKCNWLTAMSTSTAVLKEVARSKKGVRTRQIDLSMFLGVAVALAATAAGIAATGVKATYFLQPTGALIVLGGTLGVIILTTPRTGLMQSGRRVVELLWAPPIDRRALLQEIMGYVKRARTLGVLNLE